MYDYCKCKNEKCVAKTMCWRYNHRNDEGTNMNYFINDEREPDGSCDFYIEDQEVVNGR